MQAEQGPPSLGGWTPDELQSTLRQFYGVGSDYDIDAAIRFVCGVANLVRCREAVDQAHEDPKMLSVFLFAPDGGGQASLSREPMLDAGLTAIAGKIWFVNAAVMSGRAKALEVADADGVFCTVTETMRLGSVPAVVVDPRPCRTAVRYYPRGLDAPDECVPVRLHCSDVNLQQVCEVIERVYRECLRTPDAQPEGNKLWKDAAQFWPHRNAEHKVQAYLKPAFAAAFPTCHIYHEVAGVMGRADLHLEETDPLNKTSTTHLAVIELKVLRSYSDGGTPYRDPYIDECVKDGVKQAGAYRKERGHRVAALCCFDMREEDRGESCFASVKTLAETLQVATRRWYLFASSKLARDAEALDA
jgi:hypothetical protein